ncbi:putative TMV resistance protein N-like isoform X1 [Capsicum annuum]|nr:putative TMV resistance protein N-like isoform X1 [Capsicum annuum]
MESLLIYDKEYWCRAYFSERTKCDVVENNMCETFNSWIVGPRHKSVISMLEDIRHKIMDRHGDMIKFVDTWISDISPMARLILEDNKEIGRKLKVNWNHETRFEIQNGDYRHIVDLVKKTCTCRLWQLRGIPCKHVVCALYHIGHESKNYVEHWYRRDTFLRAYKYFIQPISNMIMWPESNNPPIEPPEVKPMPGRPSRIRKKAKDEPRKKKWGKASKN